MMTVIDFVKIYLLNILIREVKDNMIDIIVNRGDINNLNKPAGLKADL